MFNVLDSASAVPEVTVVNDSGTNPTVTAIVPFTHPTESKETSLNVEQSGIVLPNSDVVLPICFGKDCFDNNPVPMDDYTVLGLSELFEKPQLDRGKLSLSEYLELDKTILEEGKLRDKEKNGLYFMPVRFSKSETRLAKDVVALSCFVIDIDTGKISRRFIEDKLSSLTYIAYSSYSHQPSNPRWRVVIPYASEITPDKHKFVYKHFQKMFDGNLDKKCESVNQIWYTPACPYDAEEHYQFFVGNGELFDAESISSSMQVMNVKLSSNFLTCDSKILRVQSALDAIPSDEYATWIKVGLALFNAYEQRCYELWIGWSSKSGKFDLDTANRTWVGFRNSPERNKVGIGTIFFIAKQFGWKDKDNVPEYITNINENHFVAIDGGKTQVYIEHRDNEKELLDIRSLSFQSFQDFYKNQNIEIQTEAGPTKLNPAKRWLENPHRRTYKGIIFRPDDKAPEGYYNLWKGFAYPAISGSWSKYQEHMLNVICRGNHDDYEYLMNWMAYSVQFPHKPAGVAIVLRGERGTGKGTVISAFMELFGNHGIQISNSKHLVGHFNAHLKNCIFLFADEAFYAGDKQGESTLKALVTEKKMVVESKGIDVITAPSYLHIMMASNSDWVVPAGPHERRFLILDVGNQHMQDRKYFDEIRHELYEEQGLEAMMYDLLHKDISEFDIFAIPRTDALDEQILRSMNHEQNWWMDILGKTYSEKDWLRQNREEMQVSFSKAVSTSYEKGAATKLGMFIKKILPDGFPKKARCVTRNSPFEHVDCYEFPSQEICKEHFVKKLGLKGDPWK